MWTAPRLQEVVQRVKRIACDHMSGLLSRSHMTAAKMGSATRVPNIVAVSEIRWVPRSVSRLGSIDHTHLPRLKQAPASARGLLLSR